MRACVCGHVCTCACECLGAACGVGTCPPPFLGLEQLQTGLVPGTLTSGGLLLSVMELGCIRQTQPQTQSWTPLSP